MGAEPSTVQTRREGPAWQRPSLVVSSMALMPVMVTVAVSPAGMPVVVTASSW